MLSTMMHLSKEERESRWLEGLAGYDDINKRHLLALFALFGLSDSYIDVGCGSGIMVKTAIQLGIPAEGLDIYETIKAAWYIKHDLNNTLNLSKEYDLVTCIEVAEHIDNADIFVDNVIRLIKVGGILVFTAAVPGQLGTDHVNLKYPQDWRNVFADKGLTYCRELTVLLTILWSNIVSPMGHLVANLQVFTKGSAITKSGIKV